MKLNKPPVSEEQSILEGYVEFLLTDLSNVHPLKNTKNKNISDLVFDKSSESDYAVEHADNSINEEVLDNELEQLESKNEETIDSQSNESEQPKWSTIEKAAAKRRKLKAVEPLKQPEDEAQTEHAPDESVIEAEKVQAESLNPVVESDDLTLKEPEKKIAKDNDRSHANADLEDDFLVQKDAAVVTESSSVSHEFVEESEEEQLKEWDKVITKEKEDAYIAEHLSDDLQPEQENEIEAISEEKLEQPPGSQIQQEVNTSDPSQSDITKQTREIIESYLPEQETQDPRLKNVEKLLSRISLATMPKVAPQESVNSQQQAKQEDTPAQDPEQMAQAAQATFMHRDAQRSKDILPEVFQTLIFKVGQLPLAVPLLKLGGIIQVSEEDITPLVGTPDWFMGLVADDRGKLMVIDTQRYLMPEQTPIETSDYRYLIVLDNSNWALACNSVGDAKNLMTNDIRWSEKSSRRPWFAGMVVDYMSALIEVDELINMLADNIVD